jgi:vacuolar-type H+-ATPase subunit E/Vma4
MKSLSQAIQERLEEKRLARLEKARKEREYQEAIVEKVYQWLLDNVRVAQATERRLKAWKVSVQDWQL